MHVCRSMCVCACVHAHASKCVKQVWQDWDGSKCLLSSIREPMCFSRLLSFNSTAKIIFKAYVICLPNKQQTNSEEITPKLKALVKKQSVHFLICRQFYNSLSFSSTFSFFFPSFCSLPLHSRKHQHFQNSFLIRR